MTLLFALLSVLSLVGALALAAALISPTGRLTTARELGAWAVPVAATVATVATLGSLYMSEVEGFVPCRLCWVQRGFMYPLAAFLIVASVRKWWWVARVGIPASVGGAGVAAFHYAEQQMWIGGSEGFCDASAPCTDIWVQHFGFISIPFMAFTGFVFVASLMWLHLVTVRHRAQAVSLAESSNI